MPGGDRTGPLGLGPRTGRDLGYCSGYNRPGFMSRAFGWLGFGRGRGAGRAAGWGRAGRGRGRGRGRGWRFW